MGCTSSKDRSQIRLLEGTTMGEKTEHEGENPSAYPHFLVTKSTDPPTSYPSSSLFILLPPRKCPSTFQRPACTRSLDPFLLTLFLQLLPLPQQWPLPPYWIMPICIQRDPGSLILKDTSPLILHLLPPHTYPSFYFLRTQHFL